MFIDGETVGTNRCAVVAAFNPKFAVGSRLGIITENEATFAMFTSGHLDFNDEGAEVGCFSCAVLTLFLRPCIDSIRTVSEPASPTRVSVFSPSDVVVLD